MTHYFFTRHGESQANVDQVFAGAAESPLTPKGIADAAAEGRRLASLGTRYDLIICSALSRAAKTAELIAKEVGYPIEKIVIEPLLHERSFGSLVGKPWDSVPDETSPVFIEVGGESIDELAIRVRNSFRNIENLSADKESVLIVGHGTWYQMAVALLSGKQPSAFLEIHGIPNNTVVDLPL